MLIVAKHAAMPEQLIDEGGFPMIDMGDDSDITNILLFHTAPAPEGAFLIIENTIDDVPENREMRRFGCIPAENLRNNAPGNDWPISEQRSKEEQHTGRMTKRQGD
jgi:hypothetical protein